MQLAGFKALADETRLRILKLLSRRELCVCQIVEVLGIGQSKASRHLAHLKNARVVTDRRDGLWTYYCLAESDGWLHRRVIEWFAQAEDEIPLAAEDLEALSNLGECRDLDLEHARSGGDKRCNDVAVVGS